MHEPIGTLAQLVVTILAYGCVTDSFATDSIGFLSPPRGLYPAAGNYVGTLTITKTILPEHLSSRSTLRAQAVVAADGSVTILTTVRESPTAAANVESTVTRVVPVLTTTGPVSGPFGPRYATITTLAFYIDGKPVELSISGSLLKITYRNPPASPPAITPTQEPSFTEFEFVLRSRPN